MEQPSKGEKRDPGNEVEEWGGDGSVEHNHKQICTLKMLFILICYSSLQNVLSRYI